MGNRDTAAAWAYHDATKHSVASVRRSTHALDFDNMPLPFKVYPQLPAIPLPRDFVPSTRPALAAIAHDGTVRGEARGLDLATLAHLLYFTAGVLRRRSYPGGEAFFRAQACTGNLHHIDLYLACGALPDLTAGLYHFAPHDFALRRLRDGDQRATLVRASDGDPAVLAAPAVLACTSTPWRNAWKYQARTYRHCFWDGGTLLANLLAVAATLDVPARLVLTFVDAEVNRLLDVDGEREMTLALVALGGDVATPGGGEPTRPRADVTATAAAAPPIVSLGFETVPLSPREISYPAIAAAHLASSLGSVDEAAAWRAVASREGAPHPAATVRDGAVVPLSPSVDATSEPIERVILRRGSTREFAREAIGFDALSTILRAVGGDVPADFLPPGDALTDLYVIVHAVDGLAPGAYVFEHAHDRLVSLRLGDVRAEAGHLALGQGLAADAAVNLYWLADLAFVLARLGNRGYRAAQLEAAIRGGKTYLAAFALGLGATGLTFFDDDVTAFFSPDAAGKSVMFLMAVGRPARVTRRHA